ncbi:MAG TPA: hypothetical protein VGG48_05140 [Rhizomicrobium sp.]|jgi:hypothetical protein
MKIRILVVLALAAAIFFARDGIGWTAGGDRLEPADIAAHVGQTITVSGDVSEVFTDRRSGNTFLDMGGAYPGNAFTAIIFPQDADAFPDPQGFSGKFVRITGEIRLYRGKPEIVLRSAGQIRTR